MRSRSRTALQRRLPLALALAASVAGLLVPAVARSSARVDAAGPLWLGAPGEVQWSWSTAFPRPTHVGLLRVRFGESPTAGVPTAFHWEARKPADGACEASPASATDEDDWETLEATVQGDANDWPDRAQPTRRSWFVDVDACALRLVVDRTNAGPPALREVRVVEGARDVLLGQAATDDGAAEGYRPAGAVDGTYAGRWAGAPGKGAWTLRVDLREPTPVDRIRLVLGFDATTFARSGAGRTGRSYGVAWAPVRYTVEASEDGAHFEPIAHEPLRADGTRAAPAAAPDPRRAAPREGPAARHAGCYRRRRVAEPPTASRWSARSPRTAPTIPTPSSAPPWVLSVNANPSGQSHREIGGEDLNDAFHAKFLQRRFAALLPALRRDDRLARRVGPYGEPHDAPRSDSAGQALEAIEGDDPALDLALLSESSPPPITVLSGSNDWDYAPYTRSDSLKATRWFWDPLRDASGGGMGQLGPAVVGRVAPMLGFCGGAQILALLEARGSTPATVDDRALIDLVLKRINGHTIRGFATAKDIEWAWPSDPHPRRARVSFVPSDPLFVDLAGPELRDSTQALPEAHSDAVRPDAFLQGAPLERFDVLATSRFCGPDVVASGPRDGVVPGPRASTWCDTVTETFRSRGTGWPLIATQFHAEQRQFAAPAPGDPSSSVDDPRLFMAGAFEEIVDAYERLAR